MTARTVRTAPTRRQALGVTITFLAASALGLVLLGVVARWLSVEQNTQFLALWGLVFAFGSVMGSVEPEVSRQSAEAAVRGERVPAAVLQTTLIALAGSQLVLAVLLLTGPGRGLVTGSGVVALLVLLSLPGFSMLVLARGVMLGQHAVTQYVVVLGGEALLRVAAVLLLLAARVEPGLEWAVGAVVLGCFSWLLVLPTVLPKVSVRTGRQPWGELGARVLALGLANGLAALVITGFPTVATLVVGSSRGLGDLFAVMAFSRVPLVLLAPVQAWAVPSVVRWIRSDQHDRLHRALRGLAAGAVLLAAVGAVAGYVVGPWATGVLMGDRYEPGRLMSAAILGATCLLAAALLQVAVLVAFQRYWWMTACWALAVATAAVFLALAPFGDETRVAAGFVVACVVAMAASAVAVRRCSAEHGATSV